MNVTRNDLLQVGLRLRQTRQGRGMTLDELASRCGLSKGLLSKIENFRSVPSLPVLATICEHLNVDMGQIVEGIGQSQPTPYLLVKKTDRQTIEREDAIGFNYEMLTGQTVNDLVFESFVLTIAPGAHRKRVTTEGLQWIMILDGRIDFELGQEHIAMEQGDVLQFDGRIPHVPLNVTEQPACLLALYLINNQSGF